MSEYEDKAFFEQMQTCRAPYRRLADCIREQMRPDDSVLDIGCGVGDVIERLLELGHFVKGWDSELARAGASEAIRSRISVVDLTTPLTAPPASVVISTETGEHLPESAADTFVASIVSGRPRMVVFSAAPPGQLWPGHINLQPASYWLAKFAAKGYHDHEQRSDILRNRMLEVHAQHEHCRMNFHILMRLATPR
jgi:2-polyprenyl-3-methyl-5-hydroxy-6-metoxy-1,4-benzoquinol methylase